MILKWSPLPGGYPRTDASVNIFTSSRSLDITDFLLEVTPCTKLNKTFVLFPSPGLFFTGCVWCV